MSSTPRTTDAASVQAAYAACERLAREHYENFPVASLLLPRAMRPHVAAVYAFARTADDLADEGERPAGERHAALDECRRALHDALTGPSVADPVFVALADTIRKFDLPVQLFDDLIDAFTQDTVQTRYATFDELLDYCRRSANPIGRLVLGIGGYDSEDARLASDRVCTALQLTNFWQDLERDWQRGRLYVPQAEARAAGAQEADLDGKMLTPEWRRVMASLVHRTRNLFLRGRDVADMARGGLAFELRLTWLGGWTILERLERQDFDPFGRRPALVKMDVPLLLWRAARWRRSIR